MKTYINSLLVLCGCIILPCCSLNQPNSVDSDDGYLVEVITKNNKNSVYYVENNNMKKANSYNRNYSLEKYKEVGLKSLDTILAFKDKDSVKELIFNEIQSNVYKVTLYRELVDYKVSVIDDTFIVEGTYNDLINKSDAALYRAKAKRNKVSY